jgi:hypothetical protein
VTEFLGLLEAERVRELDHHQGIDTGRLRHGAFLVVAREGPRTGSGFRRASGWRSKVSTVETSPPLGLTPAQACGDAAMTRMDAVELSDRDGGRAEVGPALHRGRMGHHIPSTLNAASNKRE